MTLTAVVAPNLRSRAPSASTDRGLHAQVCGRPSLAPAHNRLPNHPYRTTAVQNLGGTRDMKRSWGAGSSSSVSRGYSVCNRISSAERRVRCRTVALSDGIKQDSRIHLQVASSSMNGERWSNIGCLFRNTILEPNSKASFQILEMKSAGYCSAKCKSAIILPHHQSFIREEMFCQFAQLVGYVVRRCI